MKTIRKHKVNLQKRHRIEWVLLAILTSVIVISVIADVGYLSLPKWMLRRTPNESIYQALFSAQASMVGVVIAIIAFFKPIVDSKIYGLSITRYVMTLRPIKPLQHNTVVIEVVLLTALSWGVVAYRLNNLAIALFVTTVYLLGHLAVDALRLVQASQGLELEIYEDILTLHSKIFLLTIDTKYAALAHIVNSAGQLPLDML